MAHRRTYSLHQVEMGRPELDSPPLTPPLAILSTFNLAPSRKPKHYLQHTTFLALFALIVISVYVLLFQQPTLAQVSLKDAVNSPARAASGLSKLTSDAFRLAAMRNKEPGWTSRPNTSVPPLVLTPEQELAAVSDFLASLPQNVIPSYVDPLKPIDPQLVLDFDPRSPHAADEIREIVHEVWARYPVVMYYNWHNPVSREIKSMLEGLNLLPSPAFIEFEDRPDEKVLKQLLTRLTDTPEFPLLLVGGKPVGTAQEIQYMLNKGDLGRMITRAGAVLDGQKKKKGRKH